MPAFAKATAGRPAFASATARQPGFASATARTPAALLAAAAVLGIWTALLPAAEVPPFNPSGDQAVYDLSTPPAVAIIEPIIHAAWRDQAPAAAAGVLGAMIALAGMLAAVAFGASHPAAIAVVAAVAVSAPLAATVRHAGPAALALLCVWTAWWLAARQDGDWRLTPRIVAAAALIAVGGWWFWATPVGVPVIAAAVTVESSRRVRAALAVIVAALAVSAAIFYFVHVAAIANAAAAPAQLTVAAADVWRAMHDETPRHGRTVFVGPDWAPAWTPLLGALAIAGLAASTGPRRLRAGLAVSLALCAVAGFVYQDFGGELWRFAAWAAAPAAAAGLTWLARQAPERRQTLVVAALAVVLMAVSLSGPSQPPGIDDARLFAGRFAASLAAVRGASSAVTAIVAEDTIVDSAVVAYGGGLRRVPQDADAAAFAWRAGAQVIAGPVGRRHLELLGVVFRRAQRIAEPVRFEWAAIVDRYRCVAVREDRWSLLPGLEYTGRIGVQVPAGHDGELRLIVGDTLPVALRAERPDGSPAPVKVEVLMTGPAANMPPPDYWFDGGDPLRAPRKIVRATFLSQPGPDAIVAVHLGRRAPRVLARLRGYAAAARGRVCAAPLGVDRLFSADEPAEQQLALDTEALFGAGWYGLESAGRSRFRWAAGDAVVLVPMERRGAIRVAARAAPAVTAGDAPMLALTVNGIEQTGMPMRPGAGDYTWEVPARAWVTGVNDLHFHVTRTIRPADAGGGDTRVLGFALHALTLTATAR